MYSILKVSLDFVVVDYDVITLFCWFLQDSQVWEDNGMLVTAIQSHIERSIGSSMLYSALSLDSIRHAIRALSKMGAITRTTG